MQCSLEHLLLLEKLLQILKGCNFGYVKKKKEGKLYANDKDHKKKIYKNIGDADSEKKKN